MERTHVRRFTHRYIEGIARLVDDDATCAVVDALVLQRRPGALRIIRICPHLHQLLPLRRHKHEPLGRIGRFPKGDRVDVRAGAVQFVIGNDRYFGQGPAAAPKNKDIESHTGDDQHNRCHKT